MPTHNRRHFVPQAIQYFLRQDYPHRELIVVDDGTDAIRALVPDTPHIRYLRLDHKATIGAKRNLACREARGEIIVHWDDDDWMAAWRITYQVDNLLKAQADICGLAQLRLYAPASGQAWQYVYPRGGKPWVAGGTLCYLKAFWQRHAFPNLSVGEDAHFVWRTQARKILALPDNSFYVALIHAGNTSPKRTADSRWQPAAAEEVQTLMGVDWRFYHPSQQAGKTALVTAASGIGDILRVTPLMRVFALLGYQVDVLLAPDYLEVTTLLDGAPEIRRLFYLPSPWCGAKDQRLDGLRDTCYDLAVFTRWSLPLQKLVRASRSLAFQQAQWLQEGDIACVKTIAQGVGWKGALPQPFALPSQRRFDLPPNTIALHPGCKPNWPWKKWHGFAELAALLPAVAIIGTAADLQNADTYFGKPFIWPEHAKNFVGQLNLQDTAALLRQCAALVANDSGLMHLGVAMEIPTFGIFGLTHPQREAMPAEHMYPMRQCHPQCRQPSWGQRQCAYNLQCLKTLTPHAVLNTIRTHVPAYGSVEGTSLTSKRASLAQELPTMDDIRVAYYGYVFDASGYGHAARAYIHAMHRAGLTLAVVDLANHARQVRDELVETLVDRQIEPDFHLFHGIPPQWARLAFRLRNAIGMTVWETDIMPTQWRNVLNHVLEVWLPCEFNVSVFRRALHTPIFKLPHPCLPPHTEGTPPDIHQFLGVNERDFVFYSLFEWQDRKCPLGLIEAYCRAFPTQQDTVLVIKTNPGALHVAQQAVASIRQQVRSTARLEIRCEAWSDAHIAALQARGDCYVSLHRGEGWGYPLFDAACRGTPVIATGYAGPLDYLKPQEHHLVRHELRQVQQPYVYYHPNMQWAEPDVAHAAEHMRWIYSQREVAREQAAKAAEHLQRAFSLEAIGAQARERLVQLLQRTQPQKWQRMVKSGHRHRLIPPVPIPGEWYDEDYFETGIKSNWHQGYSWTLFEGVFRECAAFLTAIFPTAHSYLDIGCAKGFLVRTLREAGKECWGFDHSPWAIAQAEAGVQPFLTLASVDAVSFERRFDLVLAFDILQQLTESQIVSFLSRVRAWTDIGMVAVIPSFTDAEEEQRYNETRHTSDLAHITMHTRHWWHDVFLRAGWRQDALHRVVEHMCQTHTLTKKMAWKLYVYAPG
jgi:ADP-heptose:LPS heptosyltransferase/glycosyltransferase involved in cell wall biosynthesis